MKTLMISCAAADLSSTLFSPSLRHPLRPHFGAGMTPGTCKAARVLIDTQQIDLARRAGVSVQTLPNFENECAGVVLVDEADGMGPGRAAAMPVK